VHRHSGPPLHFSASSPRAGEPPYANIHPMRAIFMIPSKDPPTVADAEAFSPEMLDFIAQCLRKDHRTRPTAKDLQKHPFVAGERALCLWRQLSSVIVFPPPHTLTHCAAAVARIEANGGRSTLLEELVSKCLPLIEEARREDTAAAAAAPPPAPAPARPKASDGPTEPVSVTGAWFPQPRCCVPASSLPCVTSLAGAWHAQMALRAAPSC